MSVAEYIEHGRSPMLCAVTPGEILRAVSIVGQPIQDFATVSTTQ